jgi:hypothetical protein
MGDSSPRADSKESAHADFSHGLLDFVAHVYEMAASSGQEPRPAFPHQLNAS